jgi:hemolysin activation/secretion protein
MSPAPRPSPRSPAPPVRPSAGEKVDLPAEARFLLKGFRLTGSTVLDQAAVDRVAALFLGRPVGLQEVEEIRRQLTLLYVDRGHVNSGVVVPDQTVADGVLTLQAVEGRLTEIELTGTRHYHSSYLADRLRRGVSVPFNVNDLGRQQQILLQDPFLRRLNLSIQPGLVPGEARLVGEVEEVSPYSLTALVGNTQSPTVGEVRGQLRGVAGNILGVGDILALQYGRSEGVNDGAISYSVPIASDDTRLSFRYDVNSTLVVAQNLGPLDITSRYHSIGLGLSRPFYRTAEEALTLGLSLEWRRSRTFLLGEPFSFSPGAEDGRTNVTALRFYQDWLDRNAERVVALRSTFSLGIDALGATKTGAGASGRFFAWLGQAQYVRRVFGNSEFLARGSLQLSADPLFPIEQFVLGGFATVRGYREYLAATDNAAVGTVELRVPVGRVPVPFLSTTAEAGAVQLVPFYDHGTGWNTRRPTPKNADLSSVGLGVRWLLGSGTAAEVYYGQALRRVDSGNALQDRGVHFRVVTSFF